jgi:hypothetical protein
MMLCGISIVFNSLDDVFGLMSRKHGAQNRQVLVGFQSTESLGRLQHAGGRPAQRHRGIAPSLHIATDPGHRPHHVLDRVGAGEDADFDVPSPVIAGKSPSGSRTARRSLRVETLISIRFSDAPQPCHPAAFAGLRPSCGQWASTLPSVVKAAPEIGSSGCV